jgi:hypothetical protein
MTILRDAAVASTSRKIKRLSLGLPAMLWYLKGKLLALLLGTTARLHEQKDRTHRGRLPDHPAAGLFALAVGGVPDRRGL